MAFCTSCGNEILPGARFCGNCGREQNASQRGCVECGKVLEDNEKFCSNCGNPVRIDLKPKPKPESKIKEPRLTNEGRKIVDAGPKSNQNRKSQASSPPTKKKEKSGIGCFFRTLLILLSVVVAAALLIVVVNVFFIDNDETTTASKQIAKEKNETGLTDTNIPGIVDIEPGDNSHLPENRDNESEQIQYESIKEDEDLKKVAKKVEDAFAKADTTQIKLFLAGPALSAYAGAFNEMQPHMEEFGKAFKNRTLITATDIYQVYEYSDDKGGKYTAAFELQADGNWKLTRF
jgi:hypothetical protein